MASARCALGRISPKSRPKIRPNQLKIGLNWYKSYVIKVFVMALRDPCFQTERNQLYTLARTDLLCMLNWGTQWTMVSYLKK